MQFKYKMMMVAVLATNFAHAEESTSALDEVVVTAPRSV